MKDKEITLKCEVLFDEPMSRWTTFKIGGPADILIFPKDEEDVITVFKYAAENNIPCYVLGRGSNVLVSDKGVRGIVIRTDNLNSIEINGCYLTAGAGAFLPDAARVAQKNGLAGIEFVIGIPGSLGGAAAMNAGVKEKSISEKVNRVWGIAFDGDKKEWEKEGLEFGYRKSIFSGANYLITKIELLLKKDSPEKIKERMDDYTKKRKETQPLEYPSAGSVFKNPGDNKFAGQLIDMAGCKGLRIGGACVSEKHAGFIINENRKALASDVLSLISEIQKRVKGKFGIKLEPEIKIIGEE